MIFECYLLIEISRDSKNPIRKNSKKFSSFQSSTCNTLQLQSGPQKKIKEQPARRPFTLLPSRYFLFGYACRKKSVRELGAVIISAKSSELRLFRFPLSGYPSWNFVSLASRCQEAEQPSRRRDKEDRSAGTQKSGATVQVLVGFKRKFRWLKMPRVEGPTAASLLELSLRVVGWVTGQLCHGVILVRQSGMVQHPLRLRKPSSGLVLYGLRISRSGSKLLRNGRTLNFNGLPSKSLQKPIIWFICFVAIVSKILSTDNTLQSVAFLLSMGDIVENKYLFPCLKFIKDFHFWDWLIQTKQKRHSCLQ